MVASAPRSTSATDLPTDPRRPGGGTGSRAPFQFVLTPFRLFSPCGRPDRGVLCRSRDFEGSAPARVAGRLRPSSPSRAPWSECLARSLGCRRMQGPGSLPRAAVDHRLKGMRTSGERTSVLRKKIPAPEGAGSEVWERLGLSAEPPAHCHWLRSAGKHRPWPASFHGRRKPGRPQGCAIRFAQHR